MVKGGMELRQLDHLRMIAEQGSISAAARALGIAQPSLSQSLRALEAEIGDRLFLRSRFGAQLTELGLMVSEHADEIARNVAQIRAKALYTRENPVGEVRVGWPTTVAHQLRQPIVREVRERFPGIRLRVVERMSGSLREWLLAGRLDLAIVYLADGEAGLAITPIVTEDLYLITGGPGNERARALVTMQEVCGLPLVLPGPANALRRNVEAVAAAAGLALNVALEVESLVQMKEVARDGQHHTVLPFTAVQQEIRQGTLIARRIVRPAVRRRLALALSTARPPSQATQRVTEIVEAAARRALLAGPRAQGP